GQRPAHQELQRQIGHLLGMGLLVPLPGGAPVFHQTVAYRESGGIEQIEPVATHILSQRQVQMALQVCAQGLDVHSQHLACCITGLPFHLLRIFDHLCSSSYVVCYDCSARSTSVHQAESLMRVFTLSFSGCGVPPSLAVSSNTCQRLTPLKRGSSKYSSSLPPWNTISILLLRSVRGSIPIIRHPRVLAGGSSQSSFSMISPLPLYQRMAGSSGRAAL